jgi:hypothetical protein
METLRDLYHELNKLRERTEELDLQAETRYVAWMIICDAMREITKFQECLEPHNSERVSDHE